MEVILLIQECKKTGTDIYSSGESSEALLSKLFLILYNNSPVAFLSLISGNPQKYQNLALPLVSRYYKNSQVSGKWIPLSAINEALPSPYQLESSSENYVILRYLSSLVDFYCRNPLDELQQSLDTL
jgi:hypothetical protein